MGLLRPAPKYLTSAGAAAASRPTTKLYPLIGVAVVAAARLAAGVVSLLASLLGGLPSILFAKTPSALSACSRGR